MKNILLIDSYSVANRSYHALTTPMTSKNGEDTRVIHGYLTTMLKYVKEFNIDSVVCAFDPRGKNFRHEISKEYKGTRTKMDDTIHEQIAILKKILPLLNCEVLTKDGYEADDIIGTISKRESNENKVFILSGDRDLFALIDNNCNQIYLSTSKNKGKQLYGIKEVEEHFGVLPELVTTFKALVGDASDNISGVKSIGQKTAVELIKKLGDLNKIIENIENSDFSARIKNAIINSTDDAYRSYELATIVRDVDIDYEIKPFMQDVNKEEIFSLLNEYSLTKVIEKLSLDDVETFSLEFKDLDSSKLKEITDKHEMPYDVALTLANDKAYICFRNEKVVYTIKDYTSDDINYINEGANRILTYGLIDYIDKLPFVRDGRDFFDAKLACYVIDSSQKLESEDLINKYLDEAIFIEDFSQKRDLNNKKLKKADIDSLIYDERMKYGAYFAANAVDLLEKIIVKEDVYQLFYEIEMPLLFVLYSMQKEGILIDRENLINYGKKLDEDIKNIEQNIYSLALEEFNINSPRELGEILFEKFELPNGKKNKTGWSTSVDVLETLIDVHPIVSECLTYRKLTKLRNTYINGLLDAIKEDGRIHTKFMQTVTTTGRLSSVDPNLQNLPIKSEEGKDLRKAFIPKDGYSFVDADYSQVELRLLAHLSQDERLIDDFNHGLDIHTITASRIYNIDACDVTPNQRRNAKAINFGIIYGMGAFSLSQDLGISMSDANAYIKAYFNTYKNVETYLSGLIKEAKKNGFVKTLYNRRRYIKDINSNVKFLRAAAERVTYNSPIQGSAADIMKLAMINVFHRINHDKIDANILLQIHDEILVEVKDESVEKFKHILKEEMEKATNLLVKLLVDVQSGKSMYELK